MSRERISIVIDSNEAMHGYSWSFPNGIPISIRPLIRYGCDYTLRGYVGIIGVERKSWPDYVRCLGKGSKGFLKQVRKLQKNKFHCIIVEGGMNLSIPKYSMLKHEVIATRTAMLAAHHVPVIFAGTANLASFMCLRYMKECIQRIRND